VSNLITYFQEQEQEILNLLCDLVEMESPSREKACVDRLSAHVGELMVQAGGRVESIPLNKYGNMVVGRWGDSSKEKPILIIGHLDTVWPLGTLSERPIKIEDGKLYGPGAYDMKAGATITLQVLKSLPALGLSPSVPVTVLFNGDEEIGSFGSRAMIEELAAKSQLVLCMEPAMPGGAVKTSRKGVGNYVITTRGRAAHAGGDHQKGINAIQEMAFQILKLQGLTDYSSGTTVNVGVISGGSATNVVPEECTINVDFRIATLEGGERITSAVNALRPQLAGTRLNILGGVDRPPMVRNDVMIETFTRVKEIAHRHGIELDEGGTGGGSDANFTAGLGIPSLDGLGADGDGAHAAYEHVLISSLAERAALLAAVLTEWA
jgi:glutamate carboxypeptidase